jgi:phage regulator Rha-like protein
MPDSSPELPAPLIENRIYLIRSQKVLLDSDLAELYGVPTGRLNEAVKRNVKRFPEDFMFSLTLTEAREVQALKSQNAILKRGQHRKYTPKAFTEHGIAMLSSVLTSERAILVNIAIVRTFVRLRQLLTTHEEIGRRLEQLEWRQAEHSEQIHQVFDTIQHLIEAPAEAGPQTVEPKRRIGFPTAEDGPVTPE